MRLLFGVFAAAVAIVVAGCTGPNTNISNIQLSGSTEALPPNYQELATKAVEGLPVLSAQAVTISEPRTIVGVTAFSAKRWYVCAYGLSAPSPKPTTFKPVLTMVDGLFVPPQSDGRYDVLIVFNAQAHTSLIKAYDSPLCDA